MRDFQRELGDKARAKGATVREAASRQGRPRVGFGR
jgi:hypothetical protein